MWLFIGRVVTASLIGFAVGSLIELSIRHEVEKELKRRKAGFAGRPESAPSAPPPPRDSTSEQMKESMKGYGIDPETGQFDVDEFKPGGTA